MVACVEIRFERASTLAKRGSKTQTITSIKFGKADGQAIHLFTLTNKAGMTARITDYGTILTSLLVPDKAGKLTDVVLGFDDLAGYLKGHPFFGAIAGRCANRIAKAQFTLDGKEYKLAVNNGPHSLHGGAKGFDKYVWSAAPEESAEGPALVLSRTSPDGEEGYPGTLQATCTYTLTHANELKVEFTAVTDKPTLVNLAHHTYWNLGGAAAGDILGHTIQINADNYTPVDATLIPDGTIRPVAGTCFDFHQPVQIGTVIDKPGGKPSGYDHNFVINGKGPSGNLSVGPRPSEDKPGQETEAGYAESRGITDAGRRRPAQPQPVEARRGFRIGPMMGELRWAARLADPKSGRMMELLTTEPGIQFYSGNFLDGSITARGTVCRKHQALCLETQRFPDAIHKPAWPTVILRPGQTYRHLMVHRFTV